MKGIFAMKDKTKGLLKLKLMALIFFVLAILNVGQSYAMESITFFHNDVLGSPVATTDEFGNICWLENYKPYGEKLENDDEHEPSTAGCGLDDNQIGYTGHVHDKDIGLTYMQARYYDPVVGRFMGIDPIGPRLSAQVSFNRYAYGNNNPYKFKDPDGKAGQAVLGLGFGLAVGTGVISTDTALAVGLAIAANYGLNKLAKNLFDKLFNEKIEDDDVEKDVVDPDAENRETKTRQRQEPGIDGGISDTSVESIDGETTSVRHTVKVDNEVVHDHIDHKGKHGTSKQFSDESTGVDSKDHDSGSKDHDPKADAGES